MPFERGRLPLLTLSGRARQRPRTMPGPSYLVHRRRGSVTRDDRAAPVEAPHQLTADGLDVLPCVDRGARLRERDGVEDREIPCLIARVAVFGLPEQARQEVELIFVTRAEEPAGVGCRRNAQRSR